MTDREPSRDVKFFDAIASRYDRVYGLPSEVSRPRMNAILAALPPQARVLDLGVGTGRELSALLDAGHVPTGLDFSPEMIALCNRRSRPVPVVLGNLWHALPFADGAFDAVIALHGTLAHPENDSALANFPAEVSRVLVPKGIFIAEVPTPAWLTTLDTDSAARAPLQNTIRAQRTAKDRCMHEDTVANVSIDALFLNEEAWRALLEPYFALTVEPIGTFELRLIGRALVS